MSIGKLLTVILQYSMQNVITERNWVRKTWDPF